MAPPTTEELTERQREVLDMFKEGLPTAEIAKRLGVSDNGVYQHKRRLVERGFLPKTRKNGRGRRRQRATSADGAQARPKASIFEKIVGEAHRGVQAINSEMERLDSRETELTAELETIRSRREDLTKEREVLTTVEKTIPS